MNYEYFEETTIEPTQFTIYSVPEDNSCFFRSVAHSILSQLQTSRTEHNQYYQTISSLLQPNHNYNHEQNLSELNEDVPVFKEDTESSDEEESHLAELIEINLSKNVQELIRKWIVSHQQITITELGITWSDLIQSVHDITIDEYNLYYAFPAGESIPNHVEDSKVIPERWGGYPEILALSHILEIPIYVYTAVTFNVHSQKVNTGKITSRDRAEKNVRFQLYQFVGSQYESKNTPIYLLWKKLNKKGHYYSLEKV